MTASNATAATKEIAETSTIGDPASSKRAILKMLGEHEAEIFHNGVLVAGYVAPAKRKSGLIMTDKSRDEDIYQGSIGLVVGLGPGAFKDDSVAKFHGIKLRLNDWVLYRPSDGIGIYVNQVPCRLFQDTNILMRIKNPERYWS